MSRKRNKGRNARQHTAAGQALNLAARNGNTALVVARQGAEHGLQETVATAPGNLVQGEFSTITPRILPEGVVENSSGQAAVTEGQVERRGRPTVLDDNTKTLVCTLLSVGLSRRQAAAYADVSHTTIGYAITHDETFAARVERAEQMAIIKPLLTIANLSHSSLKAAVWLLERNEKRYKPTPDELREAAEERERSEQEAHQRELRKAREIKEWSDVVHGQSAALPTTSVSGAAASTNASPSPPAGREETTAELIKRMFAEARNWDDKDEDE